MPLEPGSVQTQGVPRGHETQHGVTSLWHSDVDQLYDIVTEKNLRMGLVRWEVYRSSS
jgi:hypothetical protein